MKRLMLYACTALLLLTVASCKKGPTLFTPTSSGRPYEVLVVVQPDVWKNPAGRALFNVLDTDVPGLPQAERMFRISHVANRDYDTILKLFRNIIVVDIQDIYSAPKMKGQRDAHASPQNILTIQAHDQASFADFVSKNGKTIIDYFVKSEFNRQLSLLKEEHNNVIAADIQDMFGCSIWMPRELQGEAAKKGKKFYWASTNKATADLNFVMYTYPYRDTDTFTLDYFIHKRDSVMKVNVPGARAGMYMATDSLMVDMRNVSVNGTYMQEVRGLWYIKNDMMGGPFVSHAVVDEANGRVVVVEGFVYSPSRLKRNIMRMMEASLYSLSIPQIATIQEIPIVGVAKETSK
ncbi:MAG: DUF4837 family protein [Bacteroidaceae bacterium]